jgi:hypothetical protein
VVGLALLAAPTLLYSAFAVWGSWFFSVWGIGTVCAVVAGIMVVLLAGLAKGIADSAAEFCVLFCGVLGVISLAGAIESASVFALIDDRGVRAGSIVSVVAYWVGPFSLAWLVLKIQMGPPRQKCSEERGDQGREWGSHR